MFSFIHAADLHLDTPFSGVSGAGLPETAITVLRDASLRAWDALVDAAISRHVSFVLIAGDVYDGTEHGIRAQLAFRDGLVRLDGAGIRTFIVDGNHDPVEEGWSAIDHLPDLAHRFAPARSGASADAITFEAGGEQVTVHGISYANRTTTENLALRFDEATGHGFHVALLHANVGGDPDHEAFSPASLNDLRGRGIDYWALGHLHARQELNREDPWVLYPGNLQGRSPDRSERGPKGALLVAVDDGQVSEPSLLQLDVVRFHEVVIDISEMSTANELLGILQEQGDPGEHDGRSVILRAVVTGEGPVHDELVAPGEREHMITALRSSAALEPFSWLDRIEWNTRPASDLEEVKNGTDFLADLIATAEPSSGSEWKQGLPKLPTDVSRFLDRPVETADDAVVTRALAMALDELGRGAA